MTDKETKKIIFKQLVSFGQKLIVETTERQDTCILSSRIVVDVLARFSIKSKAMPVETRVYNKALADKILKYGYPEQGEFKKWLEDEPALWSVGIGVRNRPTERGKWNGHLIVVSDDSFIDLTLEQANRKQYKIILNPIAQFVDNKLLKSFCQHEGNLRVFLNECVVVYEYRPDNTGFIKSPDWNLKGRRREIVKIIVDSIQSEILKEKEQLK